MSLDYEMAGHHALGVETIVHCLSTIVAGYSGFTAISYVYLQALLPDLPYL
jgi:hypothetical protein